MNNRTLALLACSALLGIFFASKDMLAQDMPSESSGKKSKPEVATKQFDSKLPVDARCGRIDNGLVEWSGIIPSFPEKDWIRTVYKAAPRLVGGGSQGSQAFQLDTIFCLVGTTNKYYVEFGFNQRSQCDKEISSGPNTCRLYRVHGWSGLLLDGSNENKTINLRQRWLFQSNIVSIFQEAEVPTELDFLSCDMDSHDLFVLKAILAGGYRPRVITTEYNVNHPLDYSFAQLDLSLQFNVSEFNLTRFTCIWGVSASAWKAVMDDHGYVLVGRAEHLDLLWLRKDLVRAEWNVPPFEFFLPHLLPGANKRKQAMHAVQKNWEHIDRLLIDYDVFRASGGDIAKAKRAARSRIEEDLCAHKALPCYALLKADCPS